MELYYSDLMGKGLQCDRMEASDGMKKHTQTMQPKVKWTSTMPIDMQTPHNNSKTFSSENPSVRLRSTLVANSCGGRERRA